MPCSATINLSDNGAICKAPRKCNYTLLMMINILLNGKQPEEEENIRGREKKKPQVFFFLLFLVALARCNIVSVPGSMC